MAARFRVALILGILAVIAVTYSVAEDSCSMEEAEEVPILWLHDNYGGPCLKLWTSIGDLKGWDFNDEASSLVVPIGWKVKLYEHTNYRGDILLRKGPVKIADLKRDEPDQKNWGDTISSVKVIPPRND